MGKRGPKPFADRDERTDILSVRMAEKTRQALEEVVARKAKKERRPDEPRPSLSREVNARLHRSLRQYEQTFEEFGGAELFVLAWMLCRAMKAAGEEAYWREHPEKHHRIVIGGTALKTPVGDWLRDPKAYDEAVQHAVALLERVRPPGATPRRNNPLPVNYGDLLAEAMMGDVFKWGGADNLASELVPDDEPVARRLALKVFREFAKNVERNLKKGESK